MAKMCRCALSARTKAQGDLGTDVIIVPFDFFVWILFSHNYDLTLSSFGPDNNKRTKKNQKRISADKTRGGSLLKSYSNCKLPPTTTETGYCG